MYKWVMVTVLVQSIHDKGLVTYKTTLCTAGGCPSLKIRVTSVNSLPGGTCGLLSHGADPQSLGHSPLLHALSIFQWCP